MKYEEILKHRNDLTKVISDKNGKVGIEIGVHRAHFSKYLLENTELEKLHLVDPWGSFRRTKGDKILAEAKKRLKPYGNRTDFIRLMSNDAVSKFKDESIDFIYIDGDHTYEVCLADITEYWNKLKPGGIMAGHDYCERHTHYGVVESVRKFFGDLKHDFNIIYDSRWPTWWTIK